MNLKKINNKLEQYEFIIIDKYNEHDFMKIRKNIFRFTRNILP